jgi:hypothetical protein
MRKKGKAMSEPVIEVGPIVLVERQVENPLDTDAQRLAALEAGEDGAGWIVAHVNLVTKLGGLARVKGLTREQQVAAAHYREVYERAQIGSARATDYEAVRVDGGGGGRDVVIDGAQARREYHLAVQQLGLWQSSVLEKVLCHDMSVREAAKMIGEGKGGAGRERTVKRLVEAVDVLVDYFGPRRHRIVGEGERPVPPWMLGDDPQKTH